MHDSRRLQEQNVVLCKKGTPPLAETQIADFVAQIPMWHVEDNNGVKQLVRSYQFAGAAEAEKFSTYIQSMADAANHHPLQEVSGNTLTMRWWTHSIKGLHLNDFIMAARSDELFRNN